MWMIVLTDGFLEIFLRKYEAKLEILFTSSCYGQHMCIIVLFFLSNHCAKCYFEWKLCQNKQNDTSYENLHHVKHNGIFTFSKCFKYIKHKISTMTNVSAK